MSKKKSNIFILILLGTFAVFMALPFIWMLISAFKSSAEIISIPPTFLPKEWTFNGFKKVITEAPFFTWLTNSLIVAISGTIATVFTSILAGYIFAKFNFKGKQILFISILATMMLPFQVIMIPMYLIISKLQLLNTLWALIIPGITSAFGIFLSKQFIEAIPTAIMEAARIDGATEFSIFIKIILPQLKSIISALAIFSFMGKWNDYIWPLIAINDTNEMTVPLALSFFNSQHGGQLNVVMSASVLIILPVIIVYLIFQKQFIDGMSMTGLK